MLARYGFLAAFLAAVGAASTAFPIVARGPAAVESFDRFLESFEEGTDTLLR